MMRNLPIHEVFHAFQGEGVHMGQSAFFIRTFGCPVHCPWCDSAGTWHKDYVPTEVQRMSAEDVFAEYQKQPEPNFVVITGGEPMIHNLDELIEMFHSRGVRVHLETSGAFPLKGELVPDWITVSPKKWKMPCAETLLMADELKFIIELEEDISFYTEKCFNDSLQLTAPSIPIWLHPEWSKSQSPLVLNAISRAVKQVRNYRAGYQLHKIYGIDGLDERSRPLVPLGGNPDNGM